MDNKIIKTIIVTFLSVIAIGQIFPLVWLLNFSLVKPSELFGKDILVWPNPPQWGNYVKAWVDGKIPQYLLNSVIVNLVSIFFICLFSMFLAYAFTRMTWKLKSVFYGIFTLGLMVPIHATLLPNYISFNSLGITDSYFGLILAYIGFGLPLATFIMSGFMHTVPRELEESALMDGCNIWQIIFSIVLPITRSALVTVVIMTFISTWNEFIMAATFVSSEKFRTLPYAVYNFAGQYASNYSVQFAVMALVALPTLIVYIFMSDQITQGVADGALKG